MPDPTPLGPHHKKDPFTQNEHGPAEMPFEEGARKFKVMTELLKQRVLAECLESIPDGYEEVSHSEIPYHYSYLYFKVLKQLGLKIEFGVEEDSDIDSIPKIIYIYCSEDQVKIFHRLDQLIKDEASNGSQPSATYTRLLLETTLGILDTTSMTNTPTQGNGYWLSSKFGQHLKDNGVLDRAQLTSFLIALYENRQVSESERLLYDNLKGQGVEPLGYEELYGMASGEVRRILQEHPEITFTNQ